MSALEKGKANELATIEDIKQEVAAENIRHPHHEIYAEALLRYPTDEHIDRVEEAKLRRKLDFKIIPLLGVCYFFYVSFRASLTYCKPCQPSKQLYCSTSIKPRSHTQPSLESKMTYTSAPRTTPGCRRSSTLDGWRGRSHRI